MISGYMIGQLIQTLLASAGLKVTLLIVILSAMAAGAFFAAKQLVSFAGSILTQLVTSRDQTLADTQRRIAESDLRRTEAEMAHAIAMTKLVEKQEAAATEAKAARTELATKLNLIGTDVTLIKGKVLGGGAA